MPSVITYYHGGLTYCMENLLYGGLTYFILFFLHLCLHNQEEDKFNTF